MKKLILLLLFLLLSINIYSSDNYTIAIVPLIEDAKISDDLSFNDIKEITNYYSKKTIPPLNLKASEEVLNIFNKYLLNYMSLNSSQKKSYLEKQISYKIDEDKRKLSSLYVEIANNNYSTIDILKIEENISYLKDKVESQNILLTKLENQDDVNSIDGIDNLFDINNNIEFKIYDNYIDSYLLSNYDDFYLSIFEKENFINEIIFIEIEKINTLNNLKIYSKNLFNNERVLIFDRIIIDNSISSLTPYILESLINYYFDDLTIVKNDIDKVNIEINEITDKSVIENLKAKELVNDTINDSDIILDFDLNLLNEKDYINIPNNNKFLFFNSGTHYLLIKGNNIENYILKVISEKNNINTISKIGNTLKRGPLTLYSDVGQVNWFVNGLDLGITNSLVLDNPLIPSVILLKKNNFSNQLFSLNKPLEFKNFNLSPSWMDTTTVFEKKQSDFYQGLLNYILGCATFISIKTLNNIYINSAISPFINNLSDGMLMIAQIDIAYKLVSYLKLATK